MSPFAEIDAGDKWSGRPLFALDADVTVYWPDVRPCYDARDTDTALTRLEHLIEQDET